MLALCLIGFIPGIEGLGFYWDDWPTVWFLHLGGPATFLQGFAEDRPLLAWIFVLTTSLLGNSPSAGADALKWQLLGVFARWLASLSFWWMLRGLWSRHTRAAVWMAFLFAIYPGFGQQYISVTYSNAFLMFSLFIVSLGSMIYAMRTYAAQENPNGFRGGLHRQPLGLASKFWPLYLLSLITAGLSMFISEYFFGLELARPILLWMALDQEGKQTTRQRLRQTLIAWLPYLALMVIFVVWHTLLHDTPRASIVLFDRLAYRPLGVLLWTIFTIFQDFYEVNFLAWLRTLDVTPLAQFAPSVIRNYVIIVVACAVFTFLYLLRLRPESAEEPAESGRRNRWAKQAVILGFFACLLAGWPIWITNLHFELLFPFDRFTLMTMLPTSILVAGLLGLVSSNRKRLKSAFFYLGVLVMTLLVSLSAGSQYMQRQFYRQEWLAQKAYFWQIVWRIPAMQPGTALLTSELPFTYYSDNSLMAPLNWIYAPDLQKSSSDDIYPMPYLLYNLESRLGKELASLETGQDIFYPNRIASFTGSTSQAVVLFYDPPRCVKVIDPGIDRYLPVKPLYINEALPLSRLDLILLSSSSDAPVSAEESLRTLLGDEPEHGWCYYFEKAELYRQLEDWANVAAAGDQALRIQKEFTQKNISELLPFIEGYAFTGQWNKARKLSLQAFQTWDKMQYILCDVWGKIAQYSNQTAPVDAQGQSTIQEMLDKFQCP